MRPGSLRDSALNMVVDVGRRNARRKSVHQRVVGRQTPRLPQQRCLVAHQVHDLFQVGREQFEVIGLFGLDPETPSARARGLGQARDQRRRGRNRMIALAAHLVQIGQRPVPPIGRAPASARSSRRATFRRGEQGVIARSRALRAARRAHRRCRAASSPRRPSATAIARRENACRRRNSCSNCS